MITETESIPVKCPGCGVERQRLPTGGWCSTCGYNPKHEIKINELQNLLDTNNLVLKSKQLYEKKIEELQEIIDQLHTEIKVLRIGLVDIMDQLTKTTLSVPIIHSIRKTVRRLLVYVVCTNDNLND